MIKLSEKYDLAGRFDISEAEAKRIASNVVSEAEFIKIWETYDWWTDENTAKRLKAASDRINSHIMPDPANYLYGEHDNDYTVDCYYAGRIEPEGERNE